MIFGDRDVIGLEKKDRNMIITIFNCPLFYVNECCMLDSFVCLEAAGPGSQEQEGQKPAIIK